MTDKPKEKIGDYPVPDLVARLETWRESHRKTNQSPYEIWLLDEAIFHLKKESDMPKEGDKCEDCGRSWGHRDGDGGKDGPLSIYHKSDCPQAPKHGPTSTEERLS